MKYKNNPNALFMIFLVITLVFLGSTTARGQSGNSPSLTGWLSIIWGDSKPGSEETIMYTLTDNTGQTTLLSISDSIAQSAGGILSLNRKFVSVQGNWATSQSSKQGSPVILDVTSIVPAVIPGDNRSSIDIKPALTGSKPWISIMCKFSDYPAEPENLSFFQNMYSNAKPGLDHYWRELSFNTINVAGSTAIGWFVLPHPESYYNPTDTGQGTDLNKLRTDCIAAADASVNFALYTGINMMFNSDFDNGWAWGGGAYMTLDGVTKLWSVTWEPPWSYADISVIAHEMGHGFGLPHSSGNYGATYDNAWDVMSNDRYNCAAATDPTYGCMAQHTISYHKDILGWIPSNQKYMANGTATITIDHLALPATSNYRMAQIPIGGSATHFYTVEVRQLSGYDIKLPGKAVVIHEVNTTRNRPAYVVDSDGNGNTDDLGAMWLVGETFIDAANGISVNVLASTSNGFQITVNGGVFSPDLVVESPSVNDSTLNPGQTFSLSATVRNQGAAIASSSTLRYYRSTDSTISTADMQVGTDAVASLGSGSTSLESVSLTAPSTTGTYYYGACVDTVSSEANTSNNCSIGVVVTVSSVPTFPDLIVESPSVNDSTLNTGQTFSLSATVRNQGAAIASSSTLRYYRSTDSTISTTDMQVGTDAVTSLGSGSTSPENISLTAPSTAGTYYYGACVDTVTSETNTSNNCSAGVTVTVSSGIDQYEPDNTVGQANNIQSGVSQLHNIVPANDIDWMWFNVTKQTEVMVETFGQLGDTVLILYDESLVEVAQNDDKGDGTLFSKVHIMDLLPGKYYLRVSPFGLDNGSSFEVPAYTILLTIEGEEKQNYIMPILMLLLDN